MARYRHARVAPRSLAVHRNDRAPAGTQDRVPRGDRISARVHRRGASRAPRSGHGEEPVWPIPARLAARAAGPMKVTSTRIPEVKLVEPRVFEDDRGFFFESWNARVLASHGIDAT